MSLLSVEEHRQIIGEMEIQMLLAGVNAGALVFDWLNQHGTRPDTHANIKIYARNILRYCDSSGWLYDPALLLKLLEKLGETPHTSFGQNVPTLSANILQRKPDVTRFFHGKSAWETCHLSLALPFLNRTATRRAVEHFDERLALSPDAARVLIVNGPSGSGKTFTGDFLRLLVGLRPAQLGIAEIDFLTWAGEPLTAGVLTSNLAKQMNSTVSGEVPRLRNQRPERWAKELIIWLTGEAGRTGKTWSLFLDNFHLPGVPESSLIFIEQLMAALAGRPMAWNVTDPQMGAPLRLVVAGYAGIVPENNDFVRTENVEPITTEDLKNHFRRFYAYKGWAADEIEINTIVQRYVQLLPSLFPPIAPAAPNGNRNSPPELKWKTRELADLVLLDCKMLEERRNGVQP